MKKRDVIMILIIILLLSVTSTVLYYSFYVIEDVRDIPMNITVADFYGFDLNKGMLTMGVSQPGASAKRMVRLENTAGFPLKVQLKTYGELAKWTSFSENDFILEEGEYKQIDVSVIVPGEAEYGDYTGSVRITFKRA
jgi:uncharacterized membrane protein